MIKKISELEEASVLNGEDVIPLVDKKNGETKKVSLRNLLHVIVPKNAGAHNGIYRGEDITDLFYDGTLSKQIAKGTFDDIFIGDYIIGKVSKRKYLVADINYRLHTGDTECTTPHILMIPERVMGKGPMNSDGNTVGAYEGSDMHNTILEPYREIIRNDFEVGHILTHREYFQNAVTEAYASGGVWVDSDIDLMSEFMVYGAHIMSPMSGPSKAGSMIHPHNSTIDHSQLSLFRLNHSLVVALNDAGERAWWWLRDVISEHSFSYVYLDGCGGGGTSSVNSVYVRPAFLVY